MGLFKWFKRTFLGDDGESKKKKRGGSSSSSSGRGNSWTIAPSNPSSGRAYNAYRESEKKRKAKQESEQKRTEQNWGNVFKRGTIWTDATSKTNVDHSKIENPIKDKLDEKAKKSTENKVKYKSFADNFQKWAMEEDKTSPIALSGKGKGVNLTKKLKESSKKHEKFMGDTGKTNYQKKLEQKIGDAKREKKELEYESKNHPKSLYTARKFATGVTLGGEKALETLSDKEVKKSLKENDKEADKTWVKPIESNANTKDEKRLQATSNLHEMSGKKAKGVTGGEVGTVAELAGNMLTYGMTSDLTKGIGEKGINRIAKLTKTGETAEQALEKSKLVQKLAKGSPDRAKEISKKLASGLAEDYGINKTTGLAQSALDATATKHEDKDSSWTKEFAKNQAINLATGGALEVGSAVLKNRQAKKEAVSKIDDFINKELDSNKDNPLKKIDKAYDTATGEYKESTGLKKFKSGEQKKTDYDRLAGNEERLVKSDNVKNPEIRGLLKDKVTSATPKSVYENVKNVTGGENKVSKDAVQKSGIPYSAIEDGSSDVYLEQKKNGVGNDIRAEKLKKLDAKIKELEAKDKANIETANRLKNRMSDEMAYEFNKTEHELGAYKAQRKNLVKESSSNNASSFTYDDFLKNDEFKGFNADRKARNRLKMVDRGTGETKKEFIDRNYKNDFEVKDNGKTKQHFILDNNGKRKAVSKDQYEYAQHLKNLDRENPSAENVVTDTNHELEQLKQRKEQVQEEQKKHIQNNDAESTIKSEAELQDIEAKEKALNESEYGTDALVDDGLPVEDKGKPNNKEQSSSANSDVKRSLEDYIYESTPLKKAGGYEGSTDEMLDMAERNARSAVSDVPDKHEVVKSLNLDELKPSNALDRALTEAYDDYKRAVERGDEVEADRFADEVIKTYRAKRYSDEFGTEISHIYASGKEASSRDLNFHVPSGDELSELRQQVSTTVGESKKFADHVDDLNVEHRIKGDEKKTGKTVKTMYNNAQSDEARSIIKEMSNTGYLDTYRKHTKDDARKAIERTVANPDAVVRDISSYLSGERGFYNDDMYKVMLKAQALYAYCSRNIAENEGFQKGMAIASEYIARFGGYAGNTMNAMSCFASFSPERRYSSLFKSVSDLLTDRNANVEKVLGTAEAPTELRKMLEAVKTTKDEDELQVLYSRIFTSVNKICGNKDILSIINTYRHFAMLSSPKTQIRNIAGNVVFSAERAISDIGTRFIQDALYKAGVIDEKTVGKLTRKDVSNILGTITGTEAKYQSLDKYFNRDINIVMKTTEKFADVKKEYYKDDSLPLRVLEKGSDIVGEGLEKGDRAFVALNYKKKFLQYLNANGFDKNEQQLVEAGAKRSELLQELNKLKKEVEGNDSKELKQKLLKLKKDIADIDAVERQCKAKKTTLEDRARHYARKEAKESTYREANEFANKLNRIRNKSYSKNATTLNKIAGTAVDAVFPYTNTPANIMKQGVRYSPVGLLYNGSKFMKAIKDPKKNIYEINNLAEKLSAGATGTAIGAIGLWLGMNTLDDSVSLTTSLSGNAEDRMNKSLGVQEYAINIKAGDKQKSITLDWMTPSASSLFLGASCGKLLQSVGDNTAFTGSVWDDVSGGVKILNEVVQPVLATSMLQTFDNIISGANSDSEVSPVINTIGGMAESYTASFYPNVLRGIAKTVRPYDYNNITQSETEGGQAKERWFNNLKNGMEFRDTGAAKTNIWGEVSGKRGNIAVSAFNSLLNPANVKDVKRTKVDVENAELYKRLEKDGSSKADSVIPKSYYNTNLKVSSDGMEKKNGLKASEMKLNAVDVSTINKARNSKEGAREALKDLLVENASFNRKSVRLSDDEKKKIMGKNFKNTKEVVEWLHTTKAWKDGSDEDKANMQMAVLGQGSGAKKKGSVKAGAMKVYEAHGKTKTDFRYDNEVTSSKKAKLGDLGKTQDGKKKVLDFLEGAVKPSYSKDGTLYKNYPLKNLYPYLNKAIEDGELTGDEAITLFEAYKRSDKATFNPNYKGGRGGYRRGYRRRRYYGRRRYGRRGGGGSSGGAGKVVQLKTSAFKSDITDSDYKSMAASASGTSKKTAKIKSQLNSKNSAPKVKAPEPIIKTNKKKG